MTVTVTYVVEYKPGMLREIARLLRTGQYVDQGTQEYVLSPGDDLNGDTGEGDEEHPSVGFELRDKGCAQDEWRDGCVRLYYEDGLLVSDVGYTGYYGWERTHAEVEAWFKDTFGARSTASPDWMKPWAYYDTFDGTKLSYDEALRELPRELLTESQAQRVAAVFGPADDAPAGPAHFVRQGDGEAMTAWLAARPGEDLARWADVAVAARSAPCVHAVLAAMPSADDAAATATALLGAAIAKGSVATAKVLLEAGAEAGAQHVYDAAYAGEAMFYAVFADVRGSKPAPRG